MLNRLLGLLAAVAAIVAVWLLWQETREPLEASERMRPLSRYRSEKLPDDLPEAWRAMLAEALEAAPELDLLEPDAVVAARRALLAVPWIDPETIDVELDLPDGLRVRYAARPVYLRVSNGHASVEVDTTGTVLPAGLSRAQVDWSAIVTVDRDVEMPAPGRRFAEPLVQEALRAAREFYTLRDVSELDLVRIERRPGYSRDAVNVAPMLAFVTSSGQRICWGRSDLSLDPLGAPLELKSRRMGRILREYPGLEGVALVEIDGPSMRLEDAEGRRLPMPEVRR